MADNLDIRPAEARDAARIAEFNIALAWESEHLKLDPATVANGVKRLLADPAKGFGIVAELGGVVVGQLLVTTEWSDWRDGNIWWVQSVYVAAEARRKGVFRALYTEIEKQARATPDVVSIRLYVENQNGPAIATYVNLGFTDAGYRIYERPLTP